MSASISISPASSPANSKRISFGPGEWAGAFGDIGTDLPLLAGMLLASDMAPAPVLLLFGACQIASGLIYRMPMPVQPLKVVAALVISQRLGSEVIAGAGLAIAAVMLGLTISGALAGLARLVPVAVVRGIQAGLGAKLCILALGTYAGGQGWRGCVLAGAAAALLLWLSRRPRIPASLLLLGIGAIIVWLGGPVQTPAWRLPAVAQGWHPLTLAGVWAGFIFLALPQIPLSLGNSVLATQELAADWFPGHGVTVRKIGLSYSFLNLAAALLGGVPVCHGSGGLAGHYAFGARTGGSVILYGGFYLVAGLAVMLGAANVLMFFPLPILGVILAREGFTLVGRLHRLAGGRRAWMIALLVAVLAVAVPHGFLAGMVIGSVVEAISRRFVRAGQVQVEAEAQS
jgi:hypothetical protein